MTKKAVKPKKAQKKKPAPKAKRGRPSSYLEEYAIQAQKLCLLKHGTTNEDLAVFFGKNVDTIYEWQKKHPEFSEALRAGKVVADANVANKLYERATGAVWYEEIAFKVKHIEYNSEGRKLKEFEKVEVVRVQRAAPPDTPAIALWLKNRQPDQWRDKPVSDTPPEILPGSEYTLTPDESAPNAPIL